MKSNFTSIRMLVASPSNTIEERKLVEDVVADINQLVGRKEKFRLETILWENDAYPAVGADAQDVINRQLSEYDIFLGIMGAVFGTPTKRADSGTEEEFNRAFQKYLTQPNSIKILFYFQNLKVSIFDINPYQLLQVVNFRNRLQNLGVLYNVYESVEEFRQKLFRGLSQSLVEYISESRSRRRGKVHSTPPTRKEVSVALLDWEPQTSKENMSIFPQWGRCREVPIPLNPCRSMSIAGKLRSKSSYFRFGFKLLPIGERWFGNGSVQSEGQNLLVHIGKNFRSKQLFFTPYYNGLRLASDCIFSDKKTSDGLAVKFSVSEQNIAELWVDGHALFQAHIGPDIKNRLLILAWGDEHEFSLSLSDIVLKYS